MIVNVLISVVGLFLSQTMVCGTTVRDVNALKTDLMVGYNKNTNPEVWGVLVNVSASFAINAIGELDERLEKLTTSLTLNIEWTDKSLSWNFSETGIPGITMDRSEVWVPEFFVFNTHFDISYGIEENRYMPIFYSYGGRATFHQKITAETSCNLDTSNFPFDHHTCSIEFYANKHYVQVNAQYAEYGSRFFKPDGSWDIVETTINDGYSNIVLDITLVRKPTFFIVNLIMPLSLLAFLSPLVFLLPNNSGERVGFSITVLLAISVFMTIVADHVPRKSQPIPRVLIMLLISYVLTVLVVVIVIINARVYRIPDRVPIPRIFISLLTITQCFCYCFRRGNARTTPELGGENDETAYLNGKEQQAEKEAKLINNYFCYCIRRGSPEIGEENDKIASRNGRGQQTGKEAKRVTECFCNCFRRGHARESTEVEEEYDETSSLNGKRQQAGKEAERTKAVSWKDVSWAVDMISMSLIYVAKTFTIFLFLAVFKGKDIHAHKPL